MQCTPFCLVMPFRQKLLSLPSDLPSLQTLIFCKFLLAEFPNDLACSVSADPLAIDIDVNVDIEATRDMHCHIGSRDGLT